MLRYVIKKSFCTDKQKLEEAKKRAMKLYEDMMNQKNVIKNRELEESLKNLNAKISSDSGNNHSNSTIKDNTSKSEEALKGLSSGNKKGNPEYEKKVQELLAGYKLINKPEEKISFSSDSNYFKIENGILSYKLRRNRINNIGDFANILNENSANSNSPSSRSANNLNKWLIIYESKINKDFENLKKKIFLILKIIFLYQTYLLIKDLYTTKRISDKYSNFKLLLIAGGYSLLFIIYTMNKSFNKRVVEKIYLNIQTGESLKILMQNKNLQNSGYIETKINNLYSITSKRKNIHEIFYYNNNNKVDQLFVPKNALYDPLLLMNICHPHVKKIQIVDS